MIALCCRAAKFSLFIQVSEKMTEIYFKVKPGEKEFSIEKGGMPRVKLTAEAENGRANVQLRNKLEELTGERPGIISGQKSRRKKLVFDQDEETIREKISEGAK